MMVFLCVSAEATTWYVRSDGGTATQCLGTTDAAYPGSGTGQACAVNHPNWIFPPTGEAATRAAASGDTVILSKASDSFRIGCQNASNCRDSSVNLTIGANCDSAFPYDCDMGAIPDNVTIVGCSSTGCGCTTTAGVLTCSSTPPELWAAGRILQVVNLTNSTGVSVKDLEIDDHDDCGDGHATLNCGSADSSELSGRDGINLVNSTNSTLTHLKIHGFKRYALFGGSVNGITIDGTLLDYNSFGGWDTDSCGGAGTCGNSGTLWFKGGSTIRYAGCVEDNPGYGTIKTKGCYSQDQTGYGDGLGSGNTGGTWKFDDTIIAHNVSDGLDLLYCNRGSYSGCTVTIRRSLFEGNAGNQVKVPNDTDIQASKIMGNCGYFYGQTFTCDSGTCGASFNNCRANGVSVVYSFHTNNSPKFYGNTAFSNGDIMFENSGTCAAGTDVLVRNNVIVGGREFNDDTSINGGGGNDTVSIYYDDDTGVCDTDFIEDHNICIGFKEGSNACNGTGSNDTTTSAAVFSGTILQGPYTSPGYYTAADYADQVVLKAGSTAIDFADSSVSGAYASDFNTFARTGTWDAGALEYGSSGGGTPSTNPDSIRWGAVSIKNGTVKITF